MKRTLLTLLLGILFLPVWSQKTIIKKVSKIAEKSRLQTLPLFYPDESKARKTPQDTLHRLVINASILKNIQENMPDFLSISLPGYHGKTQVLDLMARDIHAPGFSLTNANDEKVSSATGLYYSGMIRGDENSLVALNFINHGVGGFISDETGNYELTQGADHELYTLIPGSAATSELHCAVEDNSSLITAEQVKAIRNNDFVNCRAVEIYFEADHALFTFLGSIEATADYVDRLFAQVAILFENEGIEIRMSGLKVWDTPDAYESEGPGSFNILMAFSNRMGQTGFKGDLAHLLTKKPIGGRAHLTVLCSSHTSVRTGVSGSLQNNVAEVPLFSGDVYIIAHELGHNFGSPHTHSCFWPGGPIDNCALPEGDCEDTRIIPPAGGTIMSYCSRVNLALGFGELPGNLMRNYAALCFGGTSPVENLKAVETSATQAYLTWDTPVKNQDEFELEYKEEGAGDWIKRQTTRNQVKLTGLKAGTGYQWRVKTACTGFAESTFRTSTETGYCDTEFLYTTCHGYAGIETVALNHRLLSDPAFCADKGYTFYLDNPKSLAVGKTHSFEIQMTEEQYHLYATVWIDINNNRVFEENEKIFSSKESFVRTLKGNFYLDDGIIPVSKARMRIMISTSGTPNDPCGKEYIGEVQDHYVSLVACKESPELPDRVQLDEITPSLAGLSWSNPNHNELLIEYREKGTEYWNGSWTVKPGIYLSLQPNTSYEWRLSRPCSGYLTGEFQSPKDEYCTVKYQYPFNCSTEYGLEKFTIPDLNFTLNATCSANGHMYYDANPVKMQAGKVYPFSVQFKKSYMYLHATVWIDLNGNGRFEDGEKVYASYLPYPEVQQGAFIIPPYLPDVSNTRMRIRISNNSPYYPCDEDYNGQNADIAVEISKNCEAYTMTHMSVIQPTACTKGGLSFLFNRGDGEPVTFQYTKDGVQGTLRARISKAGVYFGEVSGGDYRIESYTIGACTMPVNQTLSLNDPPPLKPVAGNTGPYLVGDTIRLSVDSGQYFYWQGPEQFYASEQKPVIADASLIHSGVYKVIVTDDDNCRAEAFTTVVVEPVLANEPGHGSVRVKVYPNPADAYFRIEVPFDGESAGTVTDALGREVKAFQFKKEAVISTGKIGPGLYTVKVKNGRSEASAKIMIR